MKNLFLFALTSILFSSFSYADDASDILDKKNEIYTSINDIISIVESSNDKDSLTALAESLTYALDAATGNIPGKCKAMGNAAGYPEILSDKECAQITTMPELTCLQASARQTYPFSLAVTECNDITAISARCIQYADQTGYPFSLAVSECPIKVTTQSQLACLKDKVDTQYPFSLAIDDCIIQ